MSENGENATAKPEDGQTLHIGDREENATDTVVADTPSSKPASIPSDGQPTDEARSGTPPTASGEQVRAASSPPTAKPEDGQAPPIGNREENATNTVGADTPSSKPASIPSDGQPTDEVRSATPPTASGEQVRAASSPPSKTKAKVLKSAMKQQQRRSPAGTSSSSSAEKMSGAGARSNTSTPGLSSQTQASQSSASSNTRQRRTRIRSRTRSSGSEPLRSGPPVPSAEELKQMESAFVLDSVALGMRANAEPHRTSPSMNIGIPQYNAQFDEHAIGYFETKGVLNTLQKTRQDRGGSSMVGQVFDTLVAGSHTMDEIMTRNEQGAGYNYEESVCGHNLSIAKPFNGYNGPNGYRRNTFPLRLAPSSFGFQGRPMQPKATAQYPDTLYSDP